MFSVNSVPREDSAKIYEVALAAFTEAKSQYALVFIPLLMPVCAFGAARLGTLGRSPTDLQR